MPEGLLEGEICHLVRAIPVIEAQSKLIEVARQVFSTDTGVSSAQSLLEMRNDHVAAGKALWRTQAISAFDVAFVENALSSPWAMAIEAIRSPRHSWRIDDDSNEGTDLAKSVTFTHTEAHAIPLRFHFSTRSRALSGLAPVLVPAFSRSEHPRGSHLPRQVHETARQAPGPALSKSLEARARPPCVSRPIRFPFETGVPNSPAWDARMKIARNQIRSGTRALWKIVPAASDA